MHRGRVRSPLISQDAVLPSGIGTSMVGAHHASQAVTGVTVRRRGRALERPAQERPHQVLVPLEAAGGDDDPAARTHVDRPVRRLEADAGHPVPLGEQPDRAHAGPRLDPPVQAALDQAANQGLTGAALIVEPAPGQLVGRNALGRAAAERGLGNRQHPGELRSLGDAVGPLAQLAEGEQRALHRPPAPRLRARVLRVIVGKAGDRVEPHGRVGLEPPHHLGSLVDERLGGAGIDHVVGQGCQIRQRVFAAVGGVDRGHVRVAGYPGHAAGPGRRPADLVELLEEPDGSSLRTRPDGRRQPGRAGAEHHHIELVH